MAIEGGMEVEIVRMETQCRVTPVALVKGS
jgi:hypothetical protein